MKEFMRAGTGIVSALFFVTFLTTAALAQQSLDDKVDRIRKIYAETGAKIEKVDRGSEDDRKGGIAVNELVVNATGKSWPAVGTYKVVHRFYYENDEENPYPSRLLKVSIATESAARRYFEEYVFDRSGALIFFFERSEDDSKPSERRIYFDSGKAFRIIDDGKTRDRLTEEDGIIANDVMATENKLRGIFEATLD